MNPALWISKTGVQAQDAKLQAIANNLANVGTTGFRADMALARSQAVEGFGFDARHMNRLEADTVNTRTGTLVQTGRDLDAAIAGPGYFAVADGEGEAYTRAGGFTLDAEGRLLLNGRSVLGEAGAIVLPPSTRVTIGEDGTLSVLAEGAVEMQQVDRLKLVLPEPGDLHKNEAGLLVSRGGEPLPTSEGVAVRGGHLESSNVSAVEEMVASMQATRDFELQMKLFKVADDLASNGNRLMRD